jgi:hypothetical protein
MSDRTLIMGYEPNLEELLDDEIMEPVLRSAHVTRDDLRRQLSRVAGRDLHPRRVERATDSED